MYLYVQPGQETTGKEEEEVHAFNIPIFTEEFLDYNKGTGRNIGIWQVFNHLVFNSATFESVNFMSRAGCYFLLWCVYGSYFY